MTPELQESLARFTERYTNGEVPWDDTLPPPEVQALTGTALPGRALHWGVATAVPPFTWRSAAGR